jgi:flagellar motility protein MotE (MotC chaperone)
MLQPQQMAKIMGSMNPDFAARITKIMNELPR